MKNIRPTTVMTILLLLSLAIVGVPVKMASANFINWSPPELAISSPLQNETYRSNVPLALTITLSGYGPNLEKMKNLYYSLDGKPDVVIAFSYPHEYTAYTPIIVTEWISGLGNGEHTLLIHGLTDMGHVFSSNVTFHVDTITPISDDSVPRIIVQSPKNETYMGFGSGLPLNYSVSKPIVWATYSINNQANVTIFGNKTIGEYKVGANNMTVYAVDATGNVGVSETVYFTMLDFVYNKQYNAFFALPISPIISVLSPQNSVYNSSNVPLTFLIDEPIILSKSVIESSLNAFPNISWIGYSLDRQNNVTLYGNITLTNLLKGEHNITVYVKDTYGNIGSSQAIVFTTKTESSPIVTYLAMTSIIIIGISTIALLLVRRNRKQVKKSLTKT